MTYRTDLTAAIRAGQEERERVRRHRDIWEELRQTSGLSALKEAADLLLKAGIDGAVAENSNGCLLLRCGVRNELRFSFETASCRLRCVSTVNEVEAVETFDPPLTVEVVQDKAVLFVRAVAAVL
jgi:hypothetical protein